jgi:hypothetical protein
MVRLFDEGNDMNTQNDADNAADYEALRKAIALKCYNICCDLAQEKWDLFKGRTKDKSYVGNTHMEGVSDGAAECAEAIHEAFGLKL